MELAAYIHDAWAYEQASQNPQATNQLTFDDFDFVDGQTNWCDWSFSPIRWQSCLLSAIAVTGLSGFGLVQHSVAASQALEPSVNVAPWCENIYLCDTSYVVEVQTLLTKRGFDLGAIDGVYGRQTKQAVIGFQRTQRNLVVDGIPGKNTLALLRDSASILSASPQRVNVVNSSDQIKQPIVIVRSNPAQEVVPQRINFPQAAGSEVGNLQILLKQRGFYQGEIDGRQGQSTTDAILKAQKAYALSPDGFAGPLTIRALLAGGSNVALSQPAIDSNPKTEDVLQFQLFLRDRGFYNEELNGTYNMATKASILKAQLAYGLKASGELSNELLVALKAQNMVSSNQISQISLPNQAAPPSQNAPLINVPITAPITVTNNAPISNQVNKDTTNSSQTVRSSQNEPISADKKS